jgi:hypothetical protein
MTLKQPGKRTINLRRKEIEAVHRSAKFLLQVSLARRRSRFSDQHVMPAKLRRVGELDKKNLAVAW